jgi:hypothetical protein
VVISGSKTPSAVFLRLAGVDMRVRGVRSFGGSSRRGGSRAGRHADIARQAMQGQGGVAVVNGKRAGARRMQRVGGAIKERMSLHVARGVGRRIGGET